MPTFNSPIARTIIYFCCIGGLLVLHSFLVMLLWHLATASSTMHRPLSFLEGAGITAFAYVVVISVKYGLKARSAYAPDAMERPTPAAPCTTPDVQHEFQAARACAGMTPEERERLKHELVTKHGCTKKPA